MADKKQKLVLSVLDFLQTSIADGTVKQDDVEGLEVASASRSLNVTFVTRTLNAHAVMLCLML
jgi:hypothetical protein